MSFWVPTVERETRHLKKQDEDDDGDFIFQATKGMSGMNVGRLMACVCAAVIDADCVFVFAPLQQVKAREDRSLLFAS
jgi:hypothetical protein